MSTLTAEDISTLMRENTPLQKALINKITKDWREEYNRSLTLKLLAGSSLPSTETLSWGLGPGHPSHPRLKTADQLYREVTEDIDHEQSDAFYRAIKRYRAWEKRQEVLEFSTQVDSLEESQAAWRAANLLVSWGLCYQKALKIHEAGTTSTFGEELPHYHPSHPRLNSTDQLRREASAALVGAPADQAEEELDTINRALPLYTEWENSLS